MIDEINKHCRNGAACRDDLLSMFALVMSNLRNTSIAFTRKNQHITLRKFLPTVHI